MIDKDELNEKVKKACRLFDEINELFPGSNVSTDIHSVDIAKMDIYGWDIKTEYSEDKKSCYLVAKRTNGGAFNITLYSKTFRFGENNE